MRFVCSIAVMDGEKQDRTYKNVAIDVESHARLLSALNEQKIQGVVSRLIDWYVSLPPDARAAITGSLSPESQVAVLRIAITQIERKGYGAGKMRIAAKDMGNRPGGQ